MKKVMLFTALAGLAAFGWAEEEENSSSPLMTYSVTPDPETVTLGSLFYARVLAGDFDTVKGREVEHCQYLRVEVDDINSGQNLQWVHKAHTSTSHLVWENQKRAWSDPKMVGVYFDWYKVRDKLLGPYNDGEVTFAQRVYIGPMPGGNNPPPGGGG